MKKKKMANKDFTSLSEAFKYLERQAQNTLRNDLADTVKQQMHEIIEEVTYQQYTPTEYIRTHELSDVKNMEVTVIDDNTIQIVNTRHEGDVDVARVVASGIGYSWTGSAIYQAQPFPRNFYEDTINFLEHYGTHIKSFKDGMRRRGIDIE
jgi:hypothetical protein